MRENGWAVVGSHKGIIPVDPTTLRAQRHALLFRRLADRCGGIPKIMELGATRLRKPSQLYRFADASAGCFAPADVIEDLELLCGEPIYSAGITEGLPSSRLVGDLLKEVCETSVSTGELMRLVMLAKASPAGITPRIRTTILQALEHVSEELRDVRTALGRDGAKPAASAERVAS